LWDYLPILLDEMKANELMECSQIENGKWRDKSDGATLSFLHTRAEVYLGEVKDDNEER
tara:strand:- start:37 stop:213 length:177 start_codon:yes stop_codon:yes gene_type:complete